MVAAHEAISASLLKDELQDPVSIEKVTVSLCGNAFVSRLVLAGLNLRHKKDFSLCEGLPNHILKGVCEDWVFFVKSQTGNVLLHFVVEWDRIGTLLHHMSDVILILIIL